MTQVEEQQNSKKQWHTEFEKPDLEQFRSPQRQSTTINYLLKSQLQCWNFAVRGTGTQQLDQTVLVTQTWRAT